MYEGTVPNDCNLSVIINLFFLKKRRCIISRKLQRSRFTRTRDKALELKEHVTKVLDQVCVGKMPFGFMPGRNTTDPIFMLRHQQEFQLHKNENTILLSDFEKTLDRFSCTFF